MRQYFVNYKQISNSPFWQNNSGPATVAVRVIYDVLPQADSQVVKKLHARKIPYIYST